MKKIKLAAVIAAAMLLTLAGCSGTPDRQENGSDANGGAQGGASEDEAALTLEEATANTVAAVITLENGETVNLELYPDLAPQTVANFIELANEGFYEGTIFHRVISGFMIQGGGYDADLNEKEADPIPGEFTANGFTNELSHTRGVISMARTNDPDSAASQFFIVHADSPHLDGLYAAFGKVADDESLAVIDEIAAAETASVVPGIFDDVPVTPIVIKSVTVPDAEAE